MAPIVAFTAPSIIPSGIVLSHLLATGLLSYKAGQSIYYTYKALPASSDTRHRQPLRRDHVRLFTVLAGISLAVAAYFGSTYASLSYRIWAAERGIELPQSIFGDKGALRGGEHPGRLHFNRWLYDTPFYQDAWEIVAEDAGSFWWGQQATLTLVCWGVFLSIEGRRRNIHNLWVFLALAQLVNLSYAQNLFFLAVLLTPVPLPDGGSDGSTSGFFNVLSRLGDRVFPRKPLGWVPGTNVYFAFLSITYATIFLIPFATHTPSFVTVVTLSRLLPAVPLVMPYILPTGFGKTHKYPHGTYDGYTRVFRTIATASLLFQLKSTAIAVFYNLPEEHYHRHSLLQPFRTEHRSPLNRISTAAGRILGTISEHPAVAAVGWDVIISGLSLGIWAAIRGLDVSKMLGSVIFFTQRPRAMEDELAEEAQGVADEEEAVKIEPQNLRKRKPHKTASSTAEVSTRSSRQSVQHADDTQEEDESDAAYRPPGNERPPEGDEDAEEDSEVAALAWGLISAGGLGYGSTSVFGAEVMAR